MFDIIWYLILSPFAVVGGFFSLALICAIPGTIAQMFKKKRK